MNSNLEAALRYAASGLPVFPCGANKAPLTPHGFKDATIDKPKIRQWWKQWPNALIGMPTGRTSGLVVLDVDMDAAEGKDGAASLREYLAHCGAELPKTRCVLTPRGGRH